MGNRSAKPPGAVKYTAPQQVAQPAPRPVQAWQGEAEGTWMAKPIKELFGGPIQPRQPPKDKEGEAPAPTQLPAPVRPSSVRERFGAPLAPIETRPPSSALETRVPPRPIETPPGPLRARRPSVASIASVQSLGSVGSECGQSDAGSQPGSPAPHKRERREHRERERRERRQSNASLYSIESHPDYSPPGSPAPLRRERRGSNASLCSVESFKSQPYSPPGSPAPQVPRRERRGSNASMFSVESFKSHMSSQSLSSTTADSTPRSIDEVGSPVSPFSEGAWDKHASRDQRKQKSRKKCAVTGWKGGKAEEKQSSWSKPLARQAAAGLVGADSDDEMSPKSPKSGRSGPKAAKKSVGDPSLFLRNGKVQNDEPWNQNARVAPPQGRSSADAETRLRPKFVDPVKLAATAEKAPKQANLFMDHIPKGSKARRNSLAGHCAADLRGQFFKDHKQMYEAEPEAEPPVKKSWAKRWLGKA